MLSIRRHTTRVYKRVATTDSVERLLIVVMVLTCILVLSGCGFAKQPNTRAATVRGGIDIATTAGLDATPIMALESMKARIGDTERIMREFFMSDEICTVGALGSESEIQTRLRQMLCSYLARRVTVQFQDQIEFWCNEATRYIMAKMDSRWPSFTIPDAVRYYGLAFCDGMRNSLTSYQPSRRLDGGYASRNVTATWADDKAFQGAFRQARQ